jgi:serine/threonine protein kinase
MIKSEWIGRIINSRYVIRKHLGGGSFGDVFEAEDSQTQQVVALKFETNDNNPHLPNEYKLYGMLAGMDGIPVVFALEEYGKSQFMVMSNLGPSLERLFRRCGKKFSLKTVLMIADQMFRIIEWVHSCGVLHRDIKPHNFLVGRGELKNKIYLIDFGVSTSYLDAKVHDHMSYSRNKGVVGTLHYVSLNTALGDQQSRRDDLESIGYVLIRFLLGRLPWQGIKDKDKADRREKVTEAKLQMPIETLCETLPHEFQQVLGTIRRLNFDEKPKYAWFRRVFRQLFLREGYVYDGIFDWDEQAPILEPAPMNFLIRTAIHYQRGNERRTKQKKCKVVLPRPRQIFVSQFAH